MIKIKFVNECYANTINNRFIFEKVSILFKILLRFQELFTRGCNHLIAEANSRRAAAGCPLVNGKTFADLSAGTVYEYITWNARNKR
jgi:hypothetical protein